MKFTIEIPDDQIAALGNALALALRALTPQTPAPPAPKPAEVAEKPTKPERLLLNEHELAKALGISAASLRRDRMLRKGCPYVKLGNSVRYRIEDVNRYLDKRSGPAPVGTPQIK